MITEQQSYRKMHFLCEKAARSCYFVPKSAVFDLFGALAFEKHVLHYKSRFVQNNHENVLLFCCCRCVEQWLYIGVYLDVEHFRLHFVYCTTVAATFCCVRRRSVG